jgi:hypothetical protein
VAGAALGGVAGSTIEGLSHLGNRVASIYRGSKDAEQEASVKVLNAFRKDEPQVMRLANDKEGMDISRQAGTPVYPVDFGGGNTKALLRSATNISPTARNIAGEKIHSRYKQQADRFATWIRSTFGGHDMDADIEVIRDLARKENGPAYRKAYDEGDRQIWTPELERLTAAPYVQAALRKAISKWKNYAVRDGFGAANPPFRVENGGIIRVGGKGLPAYPNIQLWDYAARELQDAARAAAPGSQTAGLYNDLARLLKNELDKQVPSYKAAREGAAAFFNARNAEEAGAKFVTDSSMHNATAARIVRAMKPAELANQIERSGYRSDVLNSLFVNSPRAVQRIKIALGDDGARKFEALVRVEGLLNETRFVLGNSSTVSQANDAGLATAGALTFFEGIKNVFNPTYIIAGALILGGKAAARDIDDKVATRVVEMLFSDNPRLVARGYEVISKNTVLRDALRKASDIGARQLINYLRPSGVGAAALTLGSKLHGAPEYPAEHPPADYYGGQDQQGP